MKKFLTCIACALAMTIAMPTSSFGADKKKEKKAKKKAEWVLPELTGNEGFDTYLLKCDTLNTKIKSYCDSIEFFEMAEITVSDETGEKDIQYAIVNEAGELRSSNKAFKQNMDIILAYPLIAADITGLAAYTATATASLPSLGMKALSYGKYVKSGPSIIGDGFQEMKKIYKKARGQAKQIKALKEGKIDEIPAIQAEINGGDVEAGAATLRKIEMSKADFEKQLNIIKKVDEENAGALEQNIPETYV